MRLSLLIAALLATAACGDRRSFDERYDDSAREIQERSERIDNELQPANDS